MTFAPRPITYAGYLMSAPEREFPTGAAAAKDCQFRQSKAWTWLARAGSPGMVQQIVRPLPVAGLSGGEAELCVEEDWLAERAVQDIGEQCRQVGGKEFVAAGCEFWVGPPAVLDEAGFLVGGVLGPQSGRGVGDAGEVDALTAVVLAAPVMEAGLAVPEVTSDAVNKDAGLLGKLAPGGVGQGFARIVAVQDGDRDAHGDGAESVSRRSVCLVCRARATVGQCSLSRRSGRRMADRGETSGPRCARFGPRCAEARIG